MRHRSVEKTIVGIYVTDTHVSGDMSLRIVTGGKASTVHTVDISSSVEFDHTEITHGVSPNSGGKNVLFTVVEAIEALTLQLNARADEVMAALERVRLA